MQPSVIPSRLASPHQVIRPRLTSTPGRARAFRPRKRLVRDSIRSGQPQFSFSSMLNRAKTFADKPSH